MDEVFWKIRKNTWAIVLVAVVISFVFPLPGLLLQPYLTYLLMGLMFLSCLDLRTKEIIGSFKDYKEQILILLIIHLVPPLIFFIFRRFFSDEIYLGLIIVSTAPAARSTVFLSNIYGGQPIKALVISTISNTFSPIIMPLIVWFFARTTIRVNFEDMSATLIKLVIIPLFLAVIVGRFGFGKKINKYSPSISVVILFLIIMGIISPVQHIVLGNLGQSMFLAAFIAIVTILTFVLGYFVGSDKKEKITYGITSGYKNYTLATLLALTLFNPIVALPTIVYTIIGNLLMVPLQFFNPKHSRD